MSLFPDFSKARQRQDDSAPPTEAAADERVAPTRHVLALDDAKQDREVTYLLLEAPISTPSSADRPRYAVGTGLAQRVALSYRRSLGLWSLGSLAPD